MTQSNEYIHVLIIEGGPVKAFKDKLLAKEEAIEQVAIMEAEFSDNDFIDGSFSIETKTESFEYWEARTKNHAVGVRSFELS